MSLYGVIGYHTIANHPIYGVIGYRGHDSNHPIYGVIGYRVTLSEGHMIAHYKETIVPHLVANLIYLSQIYSYYGGDMSPLSKR